MNKDKIIILAVVIAVSVLIFFVISLITESWITSGSRQEICYEDGGSLIEDDFGVPWICGTVIFKNINIVTETPDWGFYIGGIKKGESVKMTFMLEDKFQKCEIPFTVDGPSNKYSGTRVSFGTVDKHVGHKNPNNGLVYVYVNGVNLQENGKIPTRYFVTGDCKYNATLRIETNTCHNNRYWIRKLNFKTYI